MTDKLILMVNDLLAAAKAYREQQAMPDDGNAVLDVAIHAAEQWVTS